MAGPRRPPAVRWADARPSQANLEAKPIDRRLASARAVTSGSAPAPSFRGRPRTGQGSGAHLRRLAGSGAGLRRGRPRRALWMVSRRRSGPSPSATAPRRVTGLAVTDLAVDRPSRWVFETKAMDSHLALMRLPHQLRLHPVRVRGAGARCGRPLRGGQLRRRQADVRS